MAVSPVIVVYCMIVVWSVLNYDVVGEDAKNSSTTKTAPISFNSTHKFEEVLNLSKVAEGGQIVVDNKATVNTPLDTTHIGREHVNKETIQTGNHFIKVKNDTNETWGHFIKANDSRTVTTTLKPQELPLDESEKNNKSVSASKPVELPPYDVPEKNDNKKSVPKKGVSEFPNSIELNKTTTIKPLKKKPTVTEGADDAPFAPSNFAPKTNDTKIPKVDIPSIESITEQKNRKADYVVPIVAVILSVPLVAIIISILYKRGAEWWQHRHYRRMDFLIDGMYNN